MSDIILTFGPEEFKASPEYIEGIKQVMIAQIKMMRKAMPYSVAEWYCGSCKIGDTRSSTSLSFQYASKAEAKWMKARGQVYVEVKFEKVKNEKTR